MNVPVAPIAEQKVITEMLGASLAAIGVQREVNQELEVRFELLRQSILSAAFSGELVQ